MYLPINTKHYIIVRRLKKKKRIWSTKRFIELHVSMYLFVNIYLIQLVVKQKYTQV